MWILDTDHLSLFQNTHPLVTQRIRQQNPENLAITVITFEEKVKGWLNVINKYNNQLSKYDKLIWGYKGLWDEIEYFKNIKLLEFDTKACNVYAELVKQKNPRWYSRFTHCSNYAVSKWNFSNPQSERF